MYGRKKICGKFGFKMNNIIYAMFLSMLLEKPTYGYLLVEELVDFSISKDAVPYGAAYKILRSMEAEGFITSKWETQGNGPARRVYYITENGVNYLRSWLEDAKKNFEGVKKIMDRVEQILNKNTGGDIK